MNEQHKALVESVISRDEFERESQRIESLLWDAIALEAGQRVLFCGFGTDTSPIVRAIELGARVSVIESSSDRIREHDELDVEILRGSTSVIPARENAFDVAVAYYYLHEVDPFFHAQVVSELGRVARRLAIAEIAPPSDPLGRRIATLYSRAKRELGSFEHYQPIDYWRKLLAMVKADISHASFAFARVPPRLFLDETISVLLDTMKAEAIPATDLEELRLLARRPDAQLLPQSRYVLNGAATGDLAALAARPRPESGARMALRDGFAAKEQPHPALVANMAPPPEPPAASPVPAPAPPAPAAPVPFVPPRIGAPAAAAAPPPPPSPPPPPVPRPAPAPGPQFDFGIGEEKAPPPAAPFATPFAVRDDEPEGEAEAPGDGGFGWQWEPPEDEEPI